MLFAKNLPRRYWTGFIGALAISLLFTVSAFAQSGTATVRGTVTDEQGSAIAGATVDLIDVAQGTRRTQSSNEAGLFVFTPLKPGAYRIEVKKDGFKTSNLTDVQALVDTVNTYSVKLEVGNLADIVEVTSDSAFINQSDATIGNAFNSQQIIQLPLNARNVPDLLSLQPGVTPGGNVNGGRADQANVTLDGVDVNEQQGGTAFFSVLRATPDSLQEFRVTTTNPNANQGRSSGAQTSLVTSSGTNQFHGALFEYHRNTVTAANDWFNNKDGVARPAILRNNFGGKLGGPILKDRLFFFFTYEGFREASSTPVVREVPLPTLGQGIVRYFSADGSSDPTCPPGTPAGVTCLTRTQIQNFYTAANGVNPGVNQSALDVFAAAATRYRANSTSAGDGLNTSGFRFNAPTPVRQNTAIAKFDYIYSEKHAFFAKFHYQNDNATQIQQFPDTIAPKLWQHPRGLAAGHTWTISNSMVNRFTYGITRDAFTRSGDSNANSINFRFIYNPLSFTRTLSRTTPVHNFVDDFSWVKGSHTIQAGTNIRLISNNRVSQGASYDFANTNPSFYDASGDALLFGDSGFGDPIFPNVSGESQTDLRDALAAVIGRFSQYSVNLQYNRTGNLQAVGSNIPRTFKTQEYEFYAQDTWKIRSNLTATYGLRYSTSTPVYEANGVQVKPVQSLGRYFQQRVQGALNGTPFNDPITVDLAGKANNRGGYYNQDWNNFAPSVAIAWSPNFKNRFLGTLFGQNGNTTIRGGYRLVYDRIGSALAVAFDLNSTLGFASTRAIAANTFNVSDRLGPIYAGPNQSIRGLPGITIAPTLTFPLQTPADEDQRIEQSLDDTLTTPYSHSYNVTYERDLGKKFTLAVSYVGRLGRNLLVSRDIMHLNNLRDPQSGMDFYGAMAQLISLRNQNVPITSVQNMPYFQNLFPGLAGTFSVLGTPVALTATQAAYRRIARTSVGGRNTNDYTFVQLLWDDNPPSRVNNTFFQPQYATFGAYSTIGTSDYHALQVSLRKRFSGGSSFDFNYTYGHSLDIASASESSGTINSGAAFILNPLNLNANRANSDFDLRHIVNFNYIYELPFGTGKRFFGNSGRVVNALIGGWTTTGIYRFNTGGPIGDPFDDARWATNWNVQSNGIQVTRLDASPTRTGDPNLFSNPTAAFQNYRNARPGEIGNRNVLREPNFFQFDFGLYKSFMVYKEKVRATFRWEVFNLTNSQQFTGIANFRLPLDPAGQAPPSDWGKFTGIQGTPRIMQFALRIDF